MKWPIQASGPLQPTDCAWFVSRVWHSNLLAAYVSAYAMVCIWHMANKRSTNTMMAQVEGVAQFFARFCVQKLDKLRIPDFGTLIAAVSGTLNKHGTEKGSMSKLQEAKNKGESTRCLVPIVSLTNTSATKADRSVNIVLQPIEFACMSM